MEFYSKLNFERFANEFMHEIKNPVSLIRANIEYMQTRDINGVYDKNYNVIKKELQKITNTVMDFIRTTAPVDNYEKEVIFIFDLISEVIEEFNTPQSQKDVVFDLNCFDKDLKIFGEYSKICIVFFNVYKNAIEAIKDKGNISTSIINENDEVIIKVTDDGEGMNTYVESEVGKPFFTTKSDGSGLGVSICKRIVEAHSGIFSIHNNKKKGCTVEIKLKKYNKDIDTLSKTPQAL